MASDGFVVGGVSIPFSYAAGRTASRFLTEVRDHCRIYGTRCSRCGRVLVPARSFCPRCQAPLDEWVEVGPGGRLRGFAVVHRHRPYHPLAAPFAYGLIRLDGADTDLLHLVSGVPMEVLEVGLRVRPVFRQERTASILDIAYFAPEGFSQREPAAQESAPEEADHADPV